MFNFLKKPYPFIFNTYSVVIPAAVTFVLILFLAPLGFASIDFNERVVIALIISLIIAASIFTAVKALQKFATRFTNAEKWTVGKEIILWLLVLLIITLSISIVFVGVVMYQYQTVPSLNVLLNVFSRTASITLGVSIIPMVILILFEQSNHQKKQFQKATQFSHSLKEQLNALKKLQSEKEQKILFTSDTDDIELQTDANDIVFIKSDGNYIEVHYSDKQNITKKLIRNRIKTIEALLPKQMFFRCHNRFIVSKKFITKIHGNARGLTLELINSTETIPVSRSKIKDFEQFLSRP
jgi:hypothetical protein